ncbi:hypothetical protein AWZ03_008405 [Drosophila navojoa]|uniref:Uncharacterized protein n=1 Tax=Drosophila navojoa TaxID=7232 RepID=A0A484BBK6_DRONA|nr:hypothetical protein AWZ03_008405 [Drosophila navojoa]
MSIAQQQQQLELALPSMDCQSENQLPENSIRNVAKTAAQATALAMPQPVAAAPTATATTPAASSSSTASGALAKQQPTQYVINSVAMHAKATTAGLISGGTLHLHRARSAQVREI